MYFERAAIHFLSFVKSMTPVMSINMATIESRVQQFIDALQQLEQTRDAQPLLGLFSKDAQLKSIAHHDHIGDASGLTKFWGDYVENFEEVKSHFIHIHSSGDLAVLEWTSEGTLAGGSPISYQGVSILEFIGDKISRFRTYYDSAAFLPDGAKMLGREPR
jgi:ketosteroid isomerase-like protein